MWIGMRQHKSREPEGERCLANAGRAADQPGVCDPPALVSIEQRALGILVAKQRC